MIEIGIDLALTPEASWLLIRELERCIRAQTGKPEAMVLRQIVRELRKALEELGRKL